MESEPTSAPPGSAEKLAVFKRRREARLPLFSSLDAKDPLGEDLFDRGVFFVPLPKDLESHKEVNYRRYRAAKRGKLDEAGNV
jgi:hypothetical protein